MNSQRYQIVCDIFAEAEELPPERRAAFLSEVCAGDEELRFEVESLLASDAESGGFIESPALEVAAEIMANDNTAAKIGRQIGHYKILSLLGAGGMGEVWLAEDARLKRQIAVKLLSAVHRKESLARFEQEAHAASALNHPNIITIFDIGESNGWQFIATEFVDGKTLRQLIKEKSLTVQQSVEIAAQIAAALAAAHSAGIIHRDIKPENIMIRSDGIVKVLDFGLARFSVKDVSKPADRLITKPGTVMGTVTYMSPEQARGLSVDGKTDVFSLGIVLYEMLTGRQPFEGETELDVLTAILHSEPPQLSDNFPAVLKNIVSRALRKNQSERPASSEILNELRAINRNLEFSGEIENQETFINSYQDQTGELNALTGNNFQRETERFSAAAATVPPVRKNWSFQYKIAAGMILLLLTAVSGLALYGFLSNHEAPALLTETDKLLVAEFENKTGDEDFDEIFRQPLAVSLAQSPFISLVPDGQIRQTLKEMEKSPNDPLNFDIAREVCQRRGIKAFIKGTIENYGVQYLITLEAFNAENGKSLAKEQIEAADKEIVIDSLSEASTGIREKLGESLASIKKFDAPLKSSTTGSLEALKLYSLATKTITEGRLDDAISLFKQATVADPYYAGAYASLAAAYSNKGQKTAAKEYAETAFKLRDRMTEREKQRVTSFYYVFVTGEAEKDIENLEVAKQFYPRDSVNPLNLGATYVELGKFVQAEENARQAINLEPTMFFAHSNLARYLIRQSRFEEARSVYQEAIERKFENNQINSGLFTIAFASGNETEMQRQLDILKGKDEIRALMFAGNPMIFSGRVHEYEKTMEQAVTKAAKDMPETAADYAVQTALNLAALDKCPSAQSWAKRALEFDRERRILLDAALTFALCGGQTQPLTAELESQYDKDTTVNNIGLPIIRAALEMKDSPEKALETLEINRRYEGAAYFWDNYLRGKIYLKLKKSELAAAEFQKIIQNRGWAVQSPLYALAHLELAHAYGEINDTENAKKYASRFATLWEKADSDLSSVAEFRRDFKNNSVASE